MDKFTEMAAARATKLKNVRYTEHWETNTVQLPGYESRF